MWGALMAYSPFLTFFLSLAGAIFACKAHAQAKENGQALRELRRSLEEADPPKK